VKGKTPGMSKGPAGGEVVGESVGSDSTMMAGGVDGDTTRGDLLQAHFNYNCKRLSS
jgi:hypothetical protein